MRRSRVVCDRRGGPGRRRAPAAPTNPNAAQPRPAGAGTDDRTALKPAVRGTQPLNRAARRPCAALRWPPPCRRRHAGDRGPGRTLEKGRKWQGIFHRYVHGRAINPYLFNATDVCGDSPEVRARAIHSLAHRDLRTRTRPQVYTMHYDPVCMMARIQPGSESLMCTRRGDCSKWGQAKRCSSYVLLLGAR